MPDMLSEESLQRLLVHAARSVQAALTERPPSSLPEEAFSAIGGGAFVTLRRAGHLAGCIGYVEAPPPLDATVERAARAAALEDPRFPRLLAEQLSEVDVELSILSAPSPLERERLQAGLHGAILRWRGRQGLLLPQVAVEHHLDRAGFLAALCEKAGVPPGTDRREDCELLAFTVQHRGGRLAELVGEGESE